MSSSMVLFRRTVTGGKLGQAEFAKLLQDLLTHIAKSLAESPIVLAHDVKVLNNEELLLESTTKMFEEWDLDKDEKLSKDVTAFKILGLSFCLPPETSQAEQEVIFGKVFDAADYDHNGIVDRNEFAILAKSRLKSLADELEKNPHHKRRASTSALRCCLLACPAHMAAVYYLAFSAVGAWLCAGGV
eukprot:SM000019S04959  [mRNA]  locus=s19:288898:289681:+ [translate_table: standard]